MEKESIKKAVREGYAEIAKQDGSCCGPVSSCFGTPEVAKGISKEIGYTDEEIKSAPEGANLGLGCGNPIALASLKEGETVLDLGSGAGFDCFLAAQKVGKNGKIIGIDMTPEMVGRATENAKRGNYKNVEFRVGEIENLPVNDNSVDVVISNCVINMSPEKERVFREALRVLKPGGRLMVSDIVLLKPLPESIVKSIEAYIGCLAGAIGKESYLQAIKSAGFQEVKIIDESIFPPTFIKKDQSGKTMREYFGISHENLQELAGSVMSIKVQGIKLPCKR
jgi:ubiquinone/menaquinone biosynthesis C-methylase UbiE